MGEKRVELVKLNTNVTGLQRKNYHSIVAEGKTSKYYETYDHTKGFMNNDVDLELLKDGSLVVSQSYQSKMIMFMPEQVEHLRAMLGCNCMIDNNHSHIDDEKIEEDQFVEEYHKLLE